MRVPGLAWMVCVLGAAAGASVQERSCADEAAFLAAAAQKGASGAAYWNDAGNHHLRCGDAKRAEEYFERVATARPGHANANLQLARIAIDGKRYERALKHLGQVKESGPLIGLMRGEALYGSGKRTEGLAALEEARKAAAEDPRVQFTAGLTLARIGEYGKAEEAFAATMTRVPDNAEVAVNLGRAAARAGHYERAQRALETALRLSPDDADAHFEMGRMFGARKEYERAVYHLGTARKKAPERGEILLALARALEDGGYTVEAARSYDEYVGRYPQDTEARRDRALVLGFTRVRIEEGVRELSAYTKAHPKDGTGFYYLGILRAFDDADGAIAEFGKALAVEPNHRGALYARAMMLHNQGKPAEAVTDLEALLRTAPDAVRALDQLGLSYLALERPKDAERVLRKAAGIAPGEAEVLMHLGRALMDQGQEEEAQQYLAKFQRVRPAHTQGKENIQLLAFLDLTPSQRKERYEGSLRRSLKTRPDDVELQLRLARFLEEEGRGDEARWVWRNLLSLKPDARTCREAGEILLRARQFESAAEFLLRAAAELPDARVDYARAVLMRDGPEKALAVLDEANEPERGVDWWLARAKLLDAVGRSEEARRALETGLGRAGHARPDAIREAAVLLVKQGKAGEAAGVIARAPAEAKNDPDLRLTEAIVAALAGKPVEAEALVAKVEARWPEWERPYLAHALVLESTGKRKEAASKMETAAALGAKDRTAECVRARLAGRTGGVKCECESGLREMLIQGCAQ